MRPKQLLLSAIALLSAYAVLELATRSLDLPDAELVRSIEARIAELDDRNSLPGWARTAYGWGASPDERWEASFENRPGADVERVLFLGDSVTAGFGLETSRDSYPGLLHRRWNASRAVTVVNAAVPGFGVDQMILKLREIVDSHRPAIVVLAYIPHDLWRVARDANYGMPKPVFVPSGAEGWEVVAAEPANRYYRTYLRARGWGASSLWALAHVVRNRRYYLPRLHRGYYRELLQFLREDLIRSANRVGAAVAVVRLPSTWPGRGVAVVDEIGREVFDVPAGSGEYRFFDAEPCVRARATASGVDFDQAYRWHPDADGHRTMADCLEDAL